MKKLAVILITAILLSTLSGYVFADATSGKTDNGISISFKVGDEILKINNKEVKVVKPYVVNGNTLVPLRVITEAFGADVKWEPIDSGITITYSDVTILLKLKSTQAVINGEKVNMAAAPIAINGTTMVPLRFITENFGAEVSYNNQTKEITVTKAIVSDNSIKDFSLLLKRSTKERIGDSYYKWSVELPEGFEIKERSYTGDFTEFATNDEEKYLYIEIANKDNETLEYLWQDEAYQASQRSETILENKIEDIDGIQFERIITKDKYGIYERRLYISDSRIFTLSLEIDGTTSKNTDEYKKYLDSFKLTFTDKSKTEDLSDVDENDYRTYNNKTLKFSFKVPAEWQSDETDVDNVARFYDVESKGGSFTNRFSFYMYSKGSISSLDNWVEKEKQYILDEFNPSLVKVVNNERKNINGNECEIIATSLNYNNEMIYNVTVYFVGQNYRYELSFILNAEDYNKSSYKAKMSDIINSIKISEPNVSDAGSLYDPMEADSSTKMLKINGAGNKWSYDIPMNWNRVDTSNASIDYLYKDRSEQLYFEFYISPQSPAEMIALFEDLAKEAEKKGAFKTISKEVLNEKGATIYKYSNAFTDEYGDSMEYYYIIDKNGKTYTVSLVLHEMRKSNKNIKLLNDIWNSITFN